MIFELKSRPQVAQILSCTHLYGYSNRHRNGKNCFSVLLSHFEKKGAIVVVYQSHKTAPTWLADFSQQSVWYALRLV